MKLSFIYSYYGDVGYVMLLTTCESKDMIRCDEKNIKMAISSLPVYIILNEKHNISNTYSLSHFLFHGES